jgi:hypothetical protein
MARALVAPGLARDHGFDPFGSARKTLHRRNVEFFPFWCSGYFIYRPQLPGSIVLTPFISPGRRKEPAQAPFFFRSEKETGSTMNSASCGQMAKGATRGSTAQFQPVRTAMW